MDVLVGLVYEDDRRADCGIASLRLFLRDLLLKTSY